MFSCSIRFADSWMVSTGCVVRCMGGQLRLSMFTYRGCVFARHYLRTFASLCAAVVTLHAKPAKAGCLRSKFGSRKSAVAAEQRPENMSCRPQATKDQATVGRSQNGFVVRHASFIAVRNSMWFDMLNILWQGRHWSISSCECETIKSVATYIQSVE